MPTRTTLALALGRYSQRISILQRSRRLATRASTEQTLKSRLQHAERTYGLYHVASSLPGALMAR
jgi:hypothetical protein